MNTHPIVEAAGLRKWFGGTPALDGLDLAASGGLTALLGPNGAGKTTFVAAVATLVRPDAGTLRVAGIDVVDEPKQVRRLIGLAGQSASVEPALTGRENLHMVGRLFGLSRHDAAAAARSVVDRLDLGETADRLVRTYSGGMRRRLDLGASLVGRPRLLLLDEPTTGLDPTGRLELWDMIRQLVAEGTDVLLTTQYLEEADQLAREVVIIDRGRVVATGTPAELKRRVGRDVVEVRAADPATLAQLAALLGGVSGNPTRVDAPNRRVTVEVTEPAQFAAAVRAVTDSVVAIDDIALRRPTLDEVFLALTDNRRPAIQGAQP